MLQTGRPRRTERPGPHGLRASKPRPLGAASAPFPATNQPAMAETRLPAPPQFADFAILARNNLF